MAQKNVFEKIRQGVSGLVTESGPASPTKAGSPASPQSPAAIGQADGPAGQVSDKAAFDEQFKAALAGSEQITGGGVYLVGLSELRQRFGKSWESLQKKALTLACRVIERNLTAKAFYKIVGEDQFILVFPDLDPIQAQIKSLTEKLLGDSSRL